jgi:hypothetical protein
MEMARRFPPPWSVEELDACFVSRRALCLIDSDLIRQPRGSKAIGALLHRAKVVPAIFAAPHPSLLDLSVLALALRAVAPATSHPSDGQADEQSEKLVIIPSSSVVDRTIKKLSL